MDLKEGLNLTEMWRQLRQCKSDSGFSHQGCRGRNGLCREESDLFDLVEESYTPGKFSDEQEIGSGHFDALPRTARCRSSAA